MTLIATIEITGTGEDQPLVLPAPTHSEEGVALIFDDFTEDITITQEEGGAEIRIPSGEPQPFPYAPIRLAAAPTLINVANGDSVTITVHRLC